MTDIVTQLAVDAQRMHDIVNGDANTVVTTDGGPVRSVAKLIADNQTRIDDAAGVAMALSGPGAAATIATASGSNVQAELDAKATPSDITAAIGGLVGGAPGALDTLKELADALGDDANFAATVTTQLGQKAVKTDLAAAGGAALIGNGTETVADSLNALQLADYTALRAYAGPRKSVYVTGTGIAGMFVRRDDLTPATSTDNGGTRIVGAHVWDRIYVGSKLVDWFAAPGDIDNTAAIERAFKSLNNGDALEFTPRATYLISYIWAPKTDSLTGSGNVGRGRAVGVINGLSNITIRGNGATIKAVNHDIAANGGFMFIHGTKSPNVTIEGFNFDMTFTGYLDDAAFYPLCGGISMTDDYGASGVQTALCSNLTMRDMQFKLFHPLGCFCVTSHPYGTDNNNGYKILSVFASGDSAATTYESQSRNLLIEKIRFLDGHNCYGTWGVAYNNARFKEISADSWSTSSYTIAGGTRNGTNYIAPVRYYQYYTTDLTVTDIKVRSRPWAERTGAFVGRCAAVAVNSGLVGVTSIAGRNVIQNVSAMLDSDSTGLGAVFDCGILSYLGGMVEISQVNITAHTVAGVVGVYLYGAEENVQEARYVLTDITTGKNVSGPSVQLVNSSNTSDAYRKIKALTIKGCVFLGWGGEGCISSYRTGYTYHGVESLIVENCVISSSSAYSLNGSAIDVRSTNSNDSTIIANNIISGALSPMQIGSTAAARIHNNRFGTNSANANVVNYRSGFTPTLSTFAPAQAVRTSAAGSEYWSYHYIEYSSTGAIVTVLAGVANSGTGTLATVGAGNTGKLYQQLLGDIK